jgi:hypothetical protein
LSGSDMTCSGKPISAPAPIVSRLVEQYRAEKIPTLRSRTQHRNACTGSFCVKLLKMATKISALIPNVEDLLALEVEEVAGILLLHLLSFGTESGDGRVSRGGGLRGRAS